MRDLPIVAKTVFNVFLYILYVLLASVVFSFIFPLIMQLFGQDVLDPSSGVFIKIQYFIAILVLLISLILRRYFYICGRSEKEILVVEENNYTAKKKQVTKKKAEKVVKKETKKQAKIDKVVEKLQENDSDEIKIYVEKEIK